MTPSLTLVAAVEADTRKRRRTAWLVGLGLVTLLAGAAWVDGTTTRPKHDPAACADRLGIAWSYEQGATERLAEFSACVVGR